MNQETLIKVWTAVYLFAVYSCVNLLLLLRNSPVALPSALVAREETVRGPDSMAICWFFVAAVSLLTSVLLAIADLRMSAQTATLEQAPVLFGLVLDYKKNKVGHFYQVFWLILALGSCAYAIGYAAIAIEKAKTYDCDAVPNTIGTEQRWRAIVGTSPAVSWKAHTLRFDGCGTALNASEKAKQPDASTTATPTYKGIVYYVWAESVGVAVLTVASLSACLVFWFRWFTQSRKPATAAIADSTKKSSRWFAVRPILTNTLLWGFMATGVFLIHARLPDGYQSIVPIVAEFLDLPLFVAQLTGLGLLMLLLGAFRLMPSLANEYSWFKNGIVEEFFSVAINFGSIWIVSAWSAGDWDRALVRFIFGVSTLLTVYRVFRARQKRESGLEARRDGAVSESATGESLGDIAAVDQATTAKGSGQGSRSAG